MGVVIPTNKEVLTFKGLHLYHSGISNCAMRVRITLEEKGLEWSSHHLDIVKKEHITPEYFGINPNGVVPTLVHDGVVMIESDDIIDYLDKTFPDRPLRPSDPDQLKLLYHWLKLATSIHVKAVKTFIYDKRMRGKMAQSQDEQEAYARLQTNPELLEFHRKSTEGAFAQEDLDEAEQILRTCFAEADALLADSKWMVGDQFSLADIAWVPLHFTLKELAQFPFERFANIQAWADRIAERDSFKKGVLDWWPSGA